MFSELILSFRLMAGARAALNHEEEMVCLVKMVGSGSGETAPSLRALVALAEILNLVPVPARWLTTIWLQGIRYPLLTNVGTRHALGTYIYT